MADVHVLREPWADELLTRLAHPDLATVTYGVDRLAWSLLDGIGRHLAAQGRPIPVPVLILRGGLLMLSASRRALGLGPWGFLLPHTRGRGEPVTIARVDLPVAAPGTVYLLLDPIVNSGETVLAAAGRLAALTDGPPDPPVGLACLFLTERGEQRIRGQYPALEIFTVWDRMAVGENGWVTGIGFDAGDYALGALGSQRRWAA